MRKSPKHSRFRAYFDLLPRSREFPLLYNEDELSYLNGSTMNDKIRNEVAQLKDLY